ncbi:hypothetical protein ABPG75_010542 [Micractinium tetrahymenae]
MSSLKFVELGSEEEAVQLPSLPRQLTAAYCSGAPLLLPAALPASISWLGLYDCGTPALPAQVAQLSRLRCLTLEACTYSPASLNSLCSLAPTLTFLRLLRCQPPPVLAALTALQNLRLESVPRAEGAAAQQLDALLAQLQQLTALLLQDSTGEVLPPAAAALPLRRLAFLPSPARLNGPPPPLPPGAYLDTCSHLAARAATLAASADVLKQASGLLYLCFADYSGSSAFDATNWRALRGVLSMLKGLVQVSFEPKCPSAFAPLGLFDDIMWLRTKHPDLTVLRYGSADHAHATFLNHFKDD